MLQAHSFLWHYLWVAPNILLLALGTLIWKRRLHGAFPAFFSFAILSSIGELALYGADVAPSISAENFWRIDWATLLIEGPLKFAIIGQIFSCVFGSYISLARLGRLLIRALGVLLVVAAALAAAYAPKNGSFGIVSGAHLLEQTIYLIESGLLFFIFIFAAYFRLSLQRTLFGIALGLSISACVHLATWAVMANLGVSNAVRYYLDFLNMGTYHICVLIWFYFLMDPKAAGSPKTPLATPTAMTAAASHEEALALWNRELERLLQ
jgi:hypothetical protein